MKTILKKSVILGSLLLSGLAQANTPEFAKQKANEIADVINCFVGKNNKFKIENVDSAVGPMRQIRIGDLVYFGVHKDAQDQINFEKFKTLFMEMRGLKNRKTIQLVGDSGLRSVFTQEGTIAARAFLKEQFDGDHILEYGYTGGQIPHKQLDVNSFINEYLDDNPQAARRVLANVVGHSVVALKKWDCLVSPHVQNFVVVYNDNGVGDPDSPDFKRDHTFFGDDVQMSDNFLTPQDNDKMISLEGGAQSMNQAARELGLGLPIDFVSGLRQPQNYKMFSATQLVKAVAQALHGKAQLTAEDVQFVRAEYLASLDQMFDPKKGDFAEKQKLFDSQIKQFETEVARQIPTGQCRLIDLGK